MIDPSRELDGTRALITGARGFIGGRLVPRLVAAGVEAHCVSRHRTIGPAGPIWHHCELTDAPAVARLMAEVQPNLVIHLASAVTGTRDRAEVLPILHANLVAAVNVMSAMPEDARLVLAGSMEEPIGHPSTVPGSPYAAAKWAASGYARMFAALYELAIVNLRIFMVYGPGQPDRTKLIPATIDSLTAGIAPGIGSGARMVDWVYVDDVVHAIILAAVESDCVGEQIDIGTGSSHSIRTVVETLSGLIAPGVIPAFGARPDRPLEASPVADVDETRRLLGWAPEVTLSDGLRRTVAADIAQ